MDGDIIHYLPKIIATIIFIVHAAIPVPSGAGNLLLVVGDPTFQH